MTIDDEVFFTSTSFDVCFFVKAKTFLGARSKGLRIIFDPVLGHFSSNSSRDGLAAPSSDPLDDDMLESESVLRPVSVEAEDSALIKAARTLAGMELHASKRLDERVASVFVAEVSSLVLAVRSNSTLAIDEYKQ